MRHFSEPALRNRAPILEVLKRHVQPSDHLLEIASGTGQHAVWLTPRLGISWQPSDVDAASRESVDAWREADYREPQGADGARGGTLWHAIALDVRAPGDHVADVIFNANMIHITPWSVALGLFDLVMGVTPRVFVLYGPFRRGGTMVASNEAFDASLKARDPSFGIRDLETVIEEMSTRGYTVAEIVEMPANNLSVVFNLS
jgi:hypothetical protein